MLKAISKLSLFFLLLILLTIKVFATTPELIFSQYFGGSSDDFSWVIVADSDGNTYISGYTSSDDFPTTPGAYNPNPNGGDDVFIVKFDPEGDLVWSTYFGGSRVDCAFGIAVDSNGNVYIAGYTASLDFPTTPGAYNVSYNGEGDGFIAKFSPEGNLIWSTYFGGSDGDPTEGIALDENGNVYITGHTYSLDFPTTPGAYNPNPNGEGDGFIAKFSPEGNLIWSTYFGGSDEEVIRGIAVDENGNAYVTGFTYSSDFPTTYDAFDTSYADNSDGFIIKLNVEGADLVYSTYLGGIQLDKPQGIAVDENGNAYVAGFNLGGGFPVTPGAYNTIYNGRFDGFVTKINSEGSELIYSTYLGGTDHDWSFSIAIDSNGNVYIIGHTYSIDFPTTPDAFDPVHHGEADAFVARIDSTGTNLIYSTYLGGVVDDSGQGIAVDENGNVYIVGYTESPQFLATFGAYGVSNNGGADIFVAKILFPSVADLTISTTLGGTTNPTPGPHTYGIGTQAQIEAIPDDGYRFSQWTGDVPAGREEENPITIMMDSDKSLTANFKTLPPPDEPDEPDGCFIATAAYGSSLHSHVDVLRDFRDKHLMSNKLGRKLVNLYYQYSPSIADFIAKHRILKTVVQINLLPLIALSYSIVHFGLPVIAVMLVLVLLFPVLFILLYQKKFKPS